MLDRIKWVAVLSVFAPITAIILGIFGVEPAITIPAALLGVTLGLVSREE